MFQQSSVVCAVKVCVLFSQCPRIELETIISGCERSHHLSQHKMTVTSPSSTVSLQTFSLSPSQIISSRLHMPCTLPQTIPPSDAKNKHPCSQLTVLCYKSSKINWQFLSYIHIFLILKINSGLSALKLHPKNSTNHCATALTNLKMQFQY